MGKTIASRQIISFISFAFSLLLLIAALFAVYFLLLYDPTDPQNFHRDDRQHADCGECHLGKNFAVKQEAKSPEVLEKEKAIQMAHWHLMLTHFPLVGMLLGAVLLGVGLWRKSDELAKVSLSLLIFVGIMALAAYQTGKEAEIITKHQTGFSQNFINSHEDAADVATITTAALGVVALGALIFFIRKKHPVSRRFLLILLIFTIFNSVIMGYTANLGGKIKHNELILIDK
ncbi:MAG: hypothetical protein HQM14_21480 [SAR324 cluster bacterium]|nr:hypothetical protein [SAR324 cluster bacterium]